MRLPIRTRLTLVFAGLMLLVLGIAAAALLVSFRAELDRGVDSGLRLRAAAILAAPGMPLDSARGDGVFAQLLDHEGRIIRSSPGEGEAPLLSRDEISSVGESAFFDSEFATTEETVPTRVLSVPAGNGSILVIGIDVDDQREAVARLTVLVAVGGPIVMLALTALGWVIAGAALRPVERLRSEAAAISIAEPSRRLPVPRTGDELARLAETLNGMLDRLHEALGRERRFVDEASHELRTPLGVLKAEVDLALREPRSREELEAALRSIAQETERLRRLTQDLLVLARSDHGRLPVHRTEFDLSDILERVSAEFAGRARSMGVRLRSSGEGVRARVDGDRVRQAVENLVDNALRHTGGGGEVVLRAERDGGRVHLEVSDTGAGFPGELLERAFEPFARADGDRKGDGAGLGLAIVLAVAEAHGGTASVRNRPEGGASVRIDLPA
jgi:heavy metal sensor kinase